MKATILVPFRDKYDHAVVYAPGDVKEFDNDRVAALAARGLAEPLEEAPKDPEEKAEPEAKPVKPKGKGKGKSAKKDKEAADAAPDAEKVEADADTEADAPEEVEADNSNDNE